MTSGSGIETIFLPHIRTRVRAKTAAEYAANVIRYIVPGLGQLRLEALKPAHIRRFEDDIAQARFNDLSHWGYGTGWGVVRGLLDAAGLPPRKATAAHGAAVWGSAQVMLPALDVAPPSVTWPKHEIAIDAFHHAVYALATGAAYELLSSPNG